jgi:hypothetical protein
MQQSHPLLLISPTVLSIPMNSEGAANGDGEHISTLSSSFILFQPSIRHSSIWYGDKNQKHINNLIIDDNNKKIDMDTNINMKGGDQCCQDVIREKIGTNKIDDTTGNARSCMRYALS